MDFTKVFGKRERTYNYWGLSFALIVESNALNLSIRKVSTLNFKGGVSYAYTFSAQEAINTNL